jgi:hypothetical protein
MEILGDKNSILKNFSFLLPGLKEKEVETVIERTLSLLSKEKPNKLTNSIKDLTGTITATAKPIYYRFADLLSIPNKKFDEVHTAFEKLYNGKIDRKQFFESTELITQVNMSRCTSETDYLHKIFAPFYEKKKVEKLSEKESRFQPNIKFGLSFAVGRRKTSVARVWLTLGLKIFLIKKKKR